MTHCGWSVFAVLSHISIEVCLYLRWETFQPISLCSFSFTEALKSYGCRKSLSNSNKWLNRYLMPYKNRCLKLILRSFKPFEGVLLCQKLFKLTTKELSILIHCILKELFYNARWFGEIVHLAKLEVGALTEKLRKASVLD